MIPKLLNAAVLLGLGILVAYTPSVWKLLIYLVPLVSVLLFGVLVYKVFKED
jgi:uncharacterized membrane protein